jgi:hypothetical protein
MSTPPSSHLAPCQGVRGPARRPCVRTRRMVVARSHRLRIRSSERRNRLGLLFLSANALAAYCIGYPARRPAGLRIRGHVNHRFDRKLRDKPVCRKLKSQIASPTAQVRYYSN